MGYKRVRIACTHVVFTPTPLYYAGSGCANAHLFLVDLVRVVGDPLRCRPRYLEDNQGDRDRCDCQIEGTAARAAASAQVSAATARHRRLSGDLNDEQRCDHHVCTEQVRVRDLVRVKVSLKRRLRMRVRGDEEGGWRRREKDTNGRTLDWIP